MQGSAIVLSGLGALVIVLWASNPAEADKQFQKYGNGASVLGLLFGLSALAFTVWTVVKTQEIEDVARKRESETIQKANAEIEQARKAIEAAEQRSNAIIQSLSHERLWELCEKVLELLSVGQVELFTGSKWRVTYDTLTEARVKCTKVADFLGVEERERILIGNTVLDLDATIRVIGKTKFKEPGNPAEGTSTELAKAESSHEVNPEDLVKPVQVLMDIVTRIASRAEQARRYSR